MLGEIYEFIFGVQQFTKNIHLKTLLHESINYIYNVTKNTRNSHFLAY